MGYKKGRIGGLNPTRPENSENRLLFMTLNAQIHRRIQRQVFLKIGPVKLMATQTGQRLAASTVNSILAHRVRCPVSRLVASGAQVNIETGQVLVIVRAVRRMAIGTVHTTVRDIGRLFLLAGGVEMAAHAQHFLL